MAATTTSSIDHWVLMAQGFCPATGWMTWAVPTATDTAIAMRSAKPKPRENPATMMDVRMGYTSGEFQAPVKTMARELRPTSTRSRMRLAVSPSSRSGCHRRKPL